MPYPLLNPSCLKRLVAVIAFLTCLASCSFVQRSWDSAIGGGAPKTAAEDQSATEEPQAEPPKTHSVRIEALEAAFTSAEVTWEMQESSKFDGFVLHYGQNSKQLDKSVRIPLERLQAVTQNDGSKLYRYVLHDLPPDRSIWVAVSAFSGDQESTQSTALEVAPKDGLKR